MCNTVSVADRLNPHRVDVIEGNRKYFSNLLQYIRYMCVQELPYRHVDENDDDALNQGNFMELMKLNFKTNPTLNEQRENVLNQYSKHADYTSKTIFNDFIEAMADEVREEIGKELSTAGMFFSCCG